MYMSSRAARFALALFAGVLAGSLVTTLSLGTARAADECLSGPKGPTPAGGHWYYRIDHATKRHCWYVREQDEKLAQGNPPNSSPSVKPVAPTPAAAIQPSIADAHAELPAQTRIDAPDRSAAAGVVAMPADIAIGENSRAAPDAETQRSIVASRWPNQPEDVSSTDPAPNNGNAQLNSTTRPQPSVVVAAAAAELETSTTYSVPMQLAALTGALALAGILGSVIFKFGSARRPAPVKIRTRRDTIWESTDDDGIRLSADPQTGVRRRGFARNFDRANGRNDRIAEFFAQIAKRTPT
jgi:hypothetical protein